MTIRKALPNCDFLTVRMIEITNTCYLCNKNNDNVDHIFKVCTFVLGIWECIKYNCPNHLFYEGNFLSWLELVYKYYKTHCKIFKQPMEKNAIILRSIWTHRNRLVFRKIKPKPFFIIKKATSYFQNLNKLMSDDYLINEGCNVPRKLKDGFNRFLLFMKDSN